MTDTGQCTGSMADSHDKNVTEHADQASYTHNEGGRGKDNKVNRGQKQESQEQVNVHNDRGTETKKTDEVKHTEIERLKKEHNDELGKWQEEYRRLNKEKLITQRVNEELTGKMIRHASSYNDLSKELSECKEQIKRLKKEHNDELGKWQEEYRRLNEEKLITQRVNEELTGKMIRHASSYNDLSKELSECKEQIKRLEEELIDKKCDIESLDIHSKKLAEEKSKIDDLNKKHHRTIGERDSKIETLSISLVSTKKTVSELNDKIKSLTKERKRIEKEKDKEISRNLQAQKEITNRRKLDECIRTLNDTSTAYQHLLGEQEGMKARIQSLSSQVRMKDAAYRSLELERNEYVLRLSQIASCKLTANNPNIVDLSDENRPTKLAEMYSEIYDNEWTDAFAKINKESDLEKIILLRDLLKRSFEICHEVRDRQVGSWIDKITFTTTVTQQNEVEDTSKPADKEVKEPLNDSPASPIREVSSSIEVEQAQPTQRSSEEQQHSESEDLSNTSTPNAAKKEHKRNEHEFDDASAELNFQEKGTQTKNHVQKQLAVQIPATMKAETITKIKEARQRIGPHMIEFLCKELPGLLASEFDIQLTEDMDDIRKYLVSCVRLCWLMGLQMPPVYLQFEDVGDDDVQFKRNMYREYMKKGKYIDFVIWPPMLVEEAGAVLAKGVAQGKD